MSKINKEKYSVYLSNEIIVKLEKLKHKFGFNYLRDLEKEKKYIRKSKTTLSAFIKSIIINSHTYLENFNFSLDKQITKLLKLDKFNDLKKSLSGLLKNEKYRNFMNELIKHQIIENYSSTISNLTKENEFQFRSDAYTQYDFDILSSYIQNPDFPYKKIDYFNFLVYFFVNTTEKNQNDIMYYPLITKINNALYKQTSLKINKTVIKPYRIINHILTSEHTLLGVDYYTKDPILIPFHSIYEIEDFGLKTSFNDIETTQLTNITKILKIDAMTTEETFIEIKTDNIEYFNQFESNNNNITIKNIESNKYKINLLPIYLLDFSKYRKIFRLIDSSLNLSIIIKLLK